MLLWSLYVTSYVGFFFKQKTAYEMRISDWSSDVCSSDLLEVRAQLARALRQLRTRQATRHDHVGEQQGDAVVGGKLVQRLASAGRLDDLVDESGEVIDRHAAHLGAVLHYQDCGVARVDRSQLAGPHLDALPAGARTRQVETHGGAVADLAVDLHVALGLIGNAVDPPAADAGGRGPARGW